MKITIKSGTSVNVIEKIKEFINHSSTHNPDFSDKEIVFETEGEFTQIDDCEDEIIGSILLSSILSIIQWN